MGRRLAAVALVLAAGCALAGFGRGLPAAAQSIPNTLDFPVQAKAAVVVEAASGRVLYAQNANARLPMASTTKMLTALLALEQPDLWEEFAVGEEVAVEGSALGLRPGDRASLWTLACGMLLASGNDAANAAAVRIGGSLEGFAQLMNQRAAELGLEDSRFVTPSGLDAPGHYASAYDLALLARAALQNPLFARICGSASLQVPYGDPPEPRLLTNHNRLLREYPGTVGVKTGYTQKAGRCLVSAVEREGITLIAVTLDCPDDWNVHRALYGRYFPQLTAAPTQALLPGLLLPVAGGTGEAVPVRYEGPGEAVLLAGEAPRLEWELPPFLWAPVQEGQLLGWVTVRAGDGQPLARLAVKANEDLPARKKPSLWERLAGG